MKDQSVVHQAVASSERHTKTTVVARERPILFSGPMVQAILDGRKTQTRRVVKPQFGDAHDVECRGDDGVWTAYGDAPTNYDGDVQMNDWRVDFRCPYGVPGDRLWVRETFRAISPDDPDDWIYRADGYTESQLPKGFKWKPAIHMPRVASRITLEITEVRVQRLQEISEEDARAEGIRSDIIPACGDHPDLICYVAEPDDNHAYVRPREAFAKTWDDINGNRPGCAWSDNPWVWCVSFRRIKP